MRYFTTADMLEEIHKTSLERLYERLRMPSNVGYGICGAYLKALTLGNGEHILPTDRAEDAA